MATKKGGGTAENLRDSNPKYLGVKRADGQKVGIGEIIVRQRGTKMLAGRGASLGKDHTIFARKDGMVRFSSKRKRNFDGTTQTRRIVEVL